LFQASEADAVQVHSGYWFYDWCWKKEACV